MNSTNYSSTVNTKPYVLKNGGFYLKGPWQFPDESDFDYAKTKCTGCGARIMNLDASTLVNKDGEEIHIFLCNRCENLQLDDYLYIEGLGHIGMEKITKKGND